MSRPLSSAARGRSAADGLLKDAEDRLAVSGGASSSARTRLRLRGCRLPATRRPYEPIKKVAWVSNEAVVPRSGASTSAP
ncbi:MAG: hypothetical protein U5N86_01765 [Planctomycetota bacterium]|nr:hypothetical protein [Planctomycetota bacterium]